MITLEIYASLMLFHLNVIPFVNVIFLPVLREKCFGKKCIEGTIAVTNVSCEWMAILNGDL